MVFNLYKDTGLIFKGVSIFLFIVLIHRGVNSEASDIIAENIKIDTIPVVVTTAVQNTSLSKLLKNSIFKNRNSFEKQLDSLGFFKKVIKHKNDTVFYTLFSQCIIDSIFISGKDPVPFQLDDIFPKLSLPQPYDAGYINYISRKITEYYTERGYPFTSISLKLKFIDTTALHINFKIKPEKLYYFASPVIKGAPLLNSKTLQNDILIKKGDTFSLSAINETISRLKNRFYIKNATPLEPVIPPDSTRGKKTSDNKNKVTIPIEISENSGMGIDGIVGYSSGSDKGWNGLANITLQNILHRGESLELFYRGETNLQEISIHINKAYPFSLPFHIAGFFNLKIIEKEYGSLSGGLDIFTSLKKGLEIGVGTSGKEITLNNGESWYTLSADIILRRNNLCYGINKTIGAFEVRTGSGFTDESGKRYGLFNLKISSQGQLSFLKSHALFGNLSTGIISSAKDTLRDTEITNLGGHNSVRGYPIDYFSFSSFAYIQSEYRFYFSNNGSLFIFADGGTGSKGEINRKNLNTFFGYGLGIRVPVRKGRLSVTYARNYEDSKNPGRIHVRIQNSLSKGM